MIDAICTSRGLNERPMTAGLDNTPLIEKRKKPSRTPGSVAGVEPTGSEAFERKSGEAVTNKTWFEMSRPERVAAIRAAFMAGAWSSQGAARMIAGAGRAHVHSFCHRHGLNIPNTYGPPNRVGTKRIYRPHGGRSPELSRPIFPSLMSAGPKECRHRVGGDSLDGYPNVCGARVAPGRLYCQHHLDLAGGVVHAEQETVIEATQAQPGSQPQAKRKENSRTGPNVDPVDDKTGSEIVARDTVFPAVPWPRQRVTMADIVGQVCAATGIDVDDLKGPERFRILVMARQEAAWRIYTEVTGASLPMIGKALGNRDHTTALHAIRQYCRVHHLPFPRRHPDGSMTFGETV